MAVDADVLELISVLNSEGFEVLAGELLVAIGLGRELSDEEGSGTFSQADADPTKRYLGDRPPSREPILAGEQLGYAMRLLRLWLVEPVRRLAEAEVIAGRILDETFEPPFRKGKPVPIVFVPLTDGDPARMERQASPGDRIDADGLAFVLSQMAQEST